VKLASTFRRDLITSLAMSGRSWTPTGYNASLVFRTTRTPTDKLPLELPLSIVVVELASTIRRVLITSRAISGSLSSIQTPEDSH
jgi:hypothetical protein